MTEKNCNGDTGSRYWWKFVKIATKFKQGYSEIPPLKSPTNPDTCLTDIKDKANALNTYFTGISALPDIDRDLPPVGSKSAINLSTIMTDEEVLAILKILKPLDRTVSATVFLKNVECLYAPS
jgi:hypothetical protein